MCMHHTEKCFIFFPLKAVSFVKFSKMLIPSQCHSLRWAFCTSMAFAVIVHRIFFFFFLGAKAVLGLRRLYLCPGSNEEPLLEFLLRWKRCKVSRSKRPGSAVSAQRGEGAALKLGYAVEPGTSVRKPGKCTLQMKWLQRSRKLFRKQAGPSPVLLVTRQLVEKPDFNLKLQK